MAILFRFQRVVLRVAAIASLCFAVALNAAPDDEVLARFMSQANRIKTDMAVSPDDMVRVLALQKEMQALMEKTYDGLSEKARPFFKVSMMVIDPVLSEGMRYTQLIQKQTEAGVFDYPSATTVEIVDARLKMLDEIAAANIDLAKRVGNIEADIEASLKASVMTAREQAAFLAGLRKGAGKNFPAMRALRTLDKQAYEHVRSIYGLLKENMGKWSVMNGDIVFDEDAAQKVFAELAGKIQVVAERQQKVINLMAGVTETPAQNTR